MNPDPKTTHSIREVPNMTANGPAARLALEDGSLWAGRGFGAAGTRVGEVVFNTSMTGYQEILTDPSYAGQMVAMTATQIGNTGINSEDYESRGIFLRGFIVRELSPCVSRATTNSSNRRARGTARVKSIWFKR
jgi:carbamoyl-phosphate synthase small subunit